MILCPSHVLARLSGGIGCFNDPTHPLALSIPDTPDTSLLAMQDQAVMQDEAGCALIVAAPHDAPLLTRLLTSSQTPMTEGATQTTYKRGLDFWMVYVSNLVVDMLSVLDVVSHLFTVTHVPSPTSPGASADGRFDCTPDDRRSPQRNGLYLGWQRLHCRIHSYNSLRRRPRLRFWSQTCSPCFHPHLCCWLCDLWGGTEHEHAHRWPRYAAIQGAMDRIRLRHHQLSRALVAEVVCRSPRSFMRTWYPSLSVESSRESLPRECTPQLRRILVNLSIAYGLWDGMYASTRINDTDVLFVAQLDPLSEVHWQTQVLGDGCSTSIYLSVVLRSSSPPSSCACTRPSLRW